MRTLRAWGAHLAQTIGALVYNLVISRCRGRCQRPIGAAMQVQDCCATALEKGL